jgi:hypothetical protein
LGLGPCSCARFDSGCANLLIHSLLRYDYFFLD